MQHVSSFQCYPLALIFVFQGFGRVVSTWPFECVSTFTITLPYHCAVLQPSFQFFLFRQHGVLDYRVMEQLLPAKEEVKEADCRPAQVANLEQLLAGSPCHQSFAMFNSNVPIYPTSVPPFCPCGMASLQLRFFSSQVSRICAYECISWL